MIKKIFFVLLLICSSLNLLAQSQLVPPTRMGQEDRRDDTLEGKSAILILSKISNLLVSVTNVRDFKVDTRGMNNAGLYEYVVIVDQKETSNPQLEISKFADINSIKFVAKIKPSFQTAYYVEEVERPITKENQGTGAVLDAKLSEIEFTSTIPNLQVECLPALGATITRSKRKSDDKVNVITVVIPIANKEKEEERIRQKMQSIQNRIAQLKPNYATISNEEANECDELEDQLPELEKELENICVITVYAEGTNQLTFDVRDYVKPRLKMCYGVLALQTVVREHVSKCTAMIEEGGRLFTDRKYKDAKIAFTNALHSDDTPSDIIPVINSNIARCDTCLLYEQLTIGALTRIKEIKQKGAVSQTDIMEYYGAAVDFMKVAEKYNPCEYYSKSINTLETFMENMPLAMKFTIVKWFVNRVEATEGGVFPNVELWAYYGSEAPHLNDYANDRKFRKLVSNNSEMYKMVGTSDVAGIIDIELQRKNLPKGFFFRPATDDSNAQIVYKDVKDIMSQSVGEYNKRQFRMKMYVKK